jgi:alkylation response protein AidB-like acyl-CoA dehydrogenase
VAIELRPDEHVTRLRQRTREFIADSVLPVETARDGDVRGPDGDKVRRTLQQAARTAGVFAPHVARELGGHGLSMTERAPVFEAAGYSTLGPLALGINAPDKGNVHLLEAVASAEQRERYLGRSPVVKRGPRSR